MSSRLWGGDIEAIGNSKGISVSPNFKQYFEGRTISAFNFLSNLLSLPLILFMKDKTPENSSLLQGVSQKRGAHIMVKLMRMVLLRSMETIYLKL